MTNTTTPVTHETWCNAHNDSWPEDTWCVRHVPLSAPDAEPDDGIQICIDDGVGPSATFDRLAFPNYSTSPDDLRAWAQMFSEAAETLTLMQQGEKR